MKKPLKNNKLVILLPLTFLIVSAFAVVICSCGVLGSSSGTGKVTLTLKVAS